MRGGKKDCRHVKEITYKTYSLRCNPVPVGRALAAGVQGEGVAHGGPLGHSEGRRVLRRHPHSACLFLYQGCPFVP
jgi:hypothetical protein